MKQTIALASVLTIIVSSGCSILPKTEYTPPPPVKVITEEVKTEIYHPRLPDEIELEDLKFFIINKDNYDQKVKEVEELLGGNFAVFALTPSGYESMAYNLQEIRRFIRQQKEIILYYRKATKGEEADDSAQIRNGNAE